MRAVVQRVREGSVVIAGNVVAATAGGVVVLVGVAVGDTATTAVRLAGKVAQVKLGRFPFLVSAMSVN